MSLSAVALSSLTDDVLMLCLLLVGFLIAAFLGQSTGRQADWLGGEAILTIILCLTSLITGCAFSISVLGYTAREKAEVHEIQAVGRAWQYSGLLKDEDRDSARQILISYVHERIRFFQEKTSTGHRTWARLSRIRQNQLWQLAEGEAVIDDRPNTLSVLYAYSSLGDCIAQTQSVWRRQLPDAVWWILILFALSLSYLSGFRFSRINNAWRTLLFVPVLMALAMFVIAEIDLPGQGFIHVTPEGLESLLEEFQSES